MNRSAEPLRVALVGCGQIADAHLQEIRKIPTAQVVAVCDGYRDLAQRAADVFEVPAVFERADEMLAAARPEVVHITTPAGSHALLAQQCLRAGAHVYVEKPFTLDVASCRQVLETARQAGRLVCCGHNELFDPVWQQTRRRIASGALGPVVLAEAVQGYDLSGPFGALLVAEPDHWVRRLPGGFFQNIISHSVCKLSEVLPHEPLEVTARWFAPHPAAGFPTELRAWIVGRTASASLTVSSAARPLERVVRLLGTQESWEVDFERRQCRRARAISVRGPFVNFQAPWRNTTEGLATLWHSAVSFARNDIHYFAGLKGLCEAFYASIRGASPTPTPPAEILRVTAIMDAIFAACRAADSVDPVRVDQATTTEDSA